MSFKDFKNVNLQYNADLGEANMNCKSVKLKNPRKVPEGEEKR